MALEVVDFLDVLGDNNDSDKNERILSWISTSNFNRLFYGNRILCVQDRHVNMSIRSRRFSIRFVQDLHVDTSSVPDSCFVLFSAVSLEEFYAVTIAKVYAVTLRCLL